MKPLRLMIYDNTCTGRPFLPGLTHSWIVGGYLYRSLGWIDAFQGFANWQEALNWLASYDAPRPIAEIQFWGHGKWGKVLINRAPLDISALDQNHVLHNLLLKIRNRLVGPQALWWFRTCETFGAQSGHQLAQAWTNFFNCRAAGHTYIIGPFQSGLHTLSPGQIPGWSTTEGIAEGCDQNPRRALWSKWHLPNTVTCFASRFPADW